MNKYESRLVFKKKWWGVGSGIIEEDSNGVRFMRANQKFVNELPVEFAFREFLDLDVESEEAVAAFMGKWGLIYHPSRFEPFSSPKGCAWSCNETDSLEFVCCPYDETISIKEALEASEQLQLAVRTLFGFDTGECLENIGDNMPEATKIVNSAAVRGDLALFDEESFDSLSVIQGTVGDYASQMSLTNAICNQVIEVLADKYEWRECGVCERLYKWKRPISGLRKSSKRPNQQPLYCSETCSATAAKRRLRKKAKSAQ